MTSHPTPAAVAPPETPPGYEILVCESCGRENTPRPTTSCHHTVRCVRCGENSYRRLAVVALEPSELELLLELVEHALAGDAVRVADTALGDCAVVLEKLRLERRYGLVPPQEAAP